MSQLGIGVGKKTLGLYLLHKSVKDNVKTRKLQNDINAVNMVIVWLSKQHCKPEDVHIIMGATGVHHESLAYGLYRAGDRTSLASPYRTRELTRGMGTLTKNDRVDAYMLACYGAFKAPGPWPPPPEEVRHLSALLRRRDVLVAGSTREKNRLGKYLAIDTPSVITESVEMMISQLNAEIKRLDRLVRSHLDQHPELKKDFGLLISIESAGYQLGPNMLVVLRSHDFATAEQAAAFSGVVPAEKHSGTSVRGCPKLSKIGPPEIRAKLYLASLYGLRFSSLMKAMYERLCPRSKDKMCTIGALMRKLVHWCYGVLKTQEPLDVGYLSSYACSVYKTT